MAVSNRPGNRASEYGGVGGVIQPASKGHPSNVEDNADRKGVQEAAMIQRMAMHREANGLLKSRVETLNDDGSITVEIEHYTEEDIRTELGGNR